MCFFSPIRNDPKKTHKQYFGTHPVPGQSRQSIYVYVFFLSLIFGHSLRRAVFQAFHFVFFLFLFVYSRDWSNCGRGTSTFFTAAFGKRRGFVKLGEVTRRQACSKNSRGLGVGARRQ